MTKISEYIKYIRIISPLEYINNIDIFNILNINYSNFVFISTLFIKIIICIILYPIFEIYKFINDYFIKFKNLNNDQLIINEDNYEAQFDEILEFIEKADKDILDRIIQDTFYGDTPEKIGLRDLDSAVHKFYKVGFDRTKKLLKIMASKGYYLDTKNKKAKHVGKHNKVIFSYRPLFFNLMRDIVYLFNIFQAIFLGFNFKYINKTEIVHWEYISKDISHSKDNTSNNNKPLIIFTPGIYSFISVYFLMLRKMIDDYDIIFIEAPNIQLMRGYSTDVCNIIEYISDLIELHKDRKIIYMGHSFGTGLANTIINMDSNHQKIDRVVLIEPPIFLGLNLSLFYDIPSSRPNLTFWNKIVEKIYTYMFKTDFVLVNIINRFWHPYNVFPKRNFKKFIDEGKCLVVLSKNDILIDYDINKKVCNQLGISVYETDTQHGMFMLEGKNFSLMSHDLTERIKNFIE